MGLGVRRMGGAGTGEGPRVPVGSGLPVSEPARTDGDAPASGGGRGGAVELELRGDPGQRTRPADQRLVQILASVMSVRGLEACQILPPPA
jgi:hypothetical protein